MSNNQYLNDLVEPQCQYFVMRKKRLCRMTVRPGRQYCGEHEPQPKTCDGQDDRRIPCPNDPKHTVYVSKLEKHLSICNARATEQPPYIVPNINAPSEVEACFRKPLSQLSQDAVMQVIDKVNFLYEKHVKDNITTAPEHPIHATVMAEFSECNRAESSLRHLRQVSSLLWLTEQEGLVADNTCYVELGAGKGHVSYYACNAWCSSSSSGALLVDRASLRHKRDNKLRARSGRLRADLAHLALERVPSVAHCAHVVGLAKHLCGVATDFALRCVSGAGVVRRVRGVVLATCCHHRCERAYYVANQHLQELGISGDEMNVMLGIVSWATCGDGRSRSAPGAEHATGHTAPSEAGHTAPSEAGHTVSRDAGHTAPSEAGHTASSEAGHTAPSGTGNTAPREAGHTAPSEAGHTVPSEAGHAVPSEAGHTAPCEARHNSGADDTSRPELTHQYRALVGRRAKQLIDWGRVLYLRERGFDARLCYYVPSTVSLENVCIVAKKLS